jgi:outer membrane protein assembly factor BamB
VAPIQEYVGNPVAGRELLDGTLMVVLSHDLVSVARFDQSGELLGVVPVAASAAQYVVIDECGQVAVAGKTPSPSDVWLAKFDGVSGRPLWTTPFVWQGPDGAEDSPVSLLPDPSGSLLLTVVTGSNRVTFKIQGETGESIWSSAPIEGGTELSTAAAVDSSGDLYVAAPEPAPHEGTILWMLEGSTGVRLWGPRTHELAAGRDVPAHAWIGSPLGLVVAGSGSTAAFVARFDREGTLLLDPSLHESPAGAPASVGALSVSGNSIWIGGREASSTTEPRLFATCFDAGTGANCGMTRIPLGTGLVALTPAPDDEVLMTASVGITSGDLQGATATARLGRFSQEWGVEYDPGSQGTVVNFLDSRGDLVIVARSLGDPILMKRSAVNGGLSAVTPFPAALANAGIRQALRLPSGDTVLSYRNVGSSEGFVTIERLDRASGETVWKRPTPTLAPVWFMASDSAGNLIFIFRHFGQDLIQKLDGQTGAIVFGPVATPPTVYRLGVDPRGDIVLARREFPSLTTVEKRSGGSGQVMWGPSFTGHSVVSEIGFEESGDIYLAGSLGEGESSDWVVSKVHRSSGIGIWIRTFDAHAMLDVAAAIAITSGGQVVVAGFSEESSDHFRVIAGAYDAVTGASLWGPGEIGPQATSPHPDDVELAAGSLGEIFLAARFELEGELSVASLAPADGAVLWGPKGVARSATMPARRLAIDADGNPVVAVTTTTTQPDQRVYLAALSGKTGASLGDPVEFDAFFPESAFFLTAGGGATTLVSSRYFLGADAGTIRVRELRSELGVTVPAEGLIATCGRRFVHNLEARNASGTVLWSIEAGVLPHGLDLLPDGTLAGTPKETGEFAVRIGIEDSSGAKVERDLDLVVRSLCLRSRNVPSACPARVPAEVPAR